MRLPAALRRIWERVKPSRPGTPPTPARDNPYGRYFTADPTPDEIARRLREGGKKDE